MYKISPSLLAADFMHLNETVADLNASADLIHLDIMDGSFVPNLSFGFSVVEPLAKIASIPLDVHLMIVNPDKYIERFIRCGASYLSFHLEASSDPRRDLTMVRSLGAKAGLAINPDVEVKELFPYLEYCDFVLIMSVFAGFGGQKFIEKTYERIEELRKEINGRGLEVDIEVDGGVGLDNVRQLYERGVNMFVAGTSIFSAGGPKVQIPKFRKALE